MSHSSRLESFVTPMWQHRILQLMMYLRWRQLYDDSSHFGLMMLAVQLDLYLVWYSRATDGHCPFVAPSPPTNRAATPSARPWLPHAGTEHNCKVGYKWKCDKVIIQIFGTDTDQSKLCAEKNKEQNKLRECLLSFSPESFVFPFYV